MLRAQSVIAQEPSGEAIRDAWGCRLGRGTWLVYSLTVWQTVGVIGVVEGFVAGVVVDAVMDMVVAALRHHQVQRIGRGSVASGLSV